MSNSPFLKAKKDKEIKSTGVDLSMVKAEDADRVSELLAQLAEKKKYASSLAEFFENLYPWQQQFVKFTNNNQVIGAIAANRTGKTHLTTAIAACHLLGWYPPEYNGKRFDRPVKILLSAVDSNMCKDPLQEKLIGTANKKVKSMIGTGFIPKDAIMLDTVTSDRGDDIKSIAIKHSSGGFSTLMFKGYSTGREALQGFSADLIIIDEQPPDDFYSEAITRTGTTGGQVMCSFTPLEGRTSLVERFLELPGAKDSPEDKRGTKWKEGQNMAMVRAGWGDIDHITQDQMDILRKNYAPYEVEARTEGWPMVGTGRVYPVHLDEVTRPAASMPNIRGMRSLIGLDLGYGKDRDPSAGVLVSIDEATDIIYVTAEKRENTPTHHDVARLCWYLDPKLPIAWPRDANDSKFGFKGGDSASVTLREEHDLNLLPDPFLNPVGADGRKNNHKRPGFAEINSRLNDGRLIISQECVDLLDEMENYSWDDKGNTTGTDHLCDALRYAIMTLIQGHGESTSSDSWYDAYEDDDEDFYYQTY